ncbi:MAG: DUF1460 domain-containing protein [Pirellulales bacterium]|nr:DUF1460 domain-containing protein [Pirellulales bacterium]
MSHCILTSVLALAICFPTGAIQAADTPTPQVSTTDPGSTEPGILRSEQLLACENLDLDPQQVQELMAKPLHQFTEMEVDIYLRFLHAVEPDVRRRVAHLARKNLGQPYELYLLGELPFEPYDPQPIYCLAKSDCLVFAEHTYAMAIGNDWTSFMRLLQRIRYRDGQIGVVTRNHYTEADWNTSNRWLVRDMTGDLAKDRAVPFEQKIDRARFFKNRYHLAIDIPIQIHRDIYLSYEDIDLAKPSLADGDFVNIVRGIAKKDVPPNETFGSSAWVGHVGMIVLGDGGEPHLIHSAKPEVREEVLDDYIAAEAEKVAERDAAGQARLIGFKFLRLENDPLGNLRQLDGPDAPKITLPAGIPAQFHAP